METRTIWIIGIAALPFIIWVGPILLSKKNVRDWRLNRIRKSALKYIGLLDKIMKLEHYPRQSRRQFWRDFVKDGRFLNE